MFQFAGIKDFDWTMFFIVMIICGLGVLQIFSATHDTVWQGSWWKQLVFIAAGIVLMWVAANIDYHALMNHVYPLYLASIALLIAVLVIGKRAFGSTRWIALPAGIHLQVSEFAKIAIVLLLTRLLTELRTDVLELRDLLKLSALVLLPMALIAKEPDLGTALTYLPILAIGIFLAGMPWKYWLAIGVVAAIILPIGFASMQAYQKARIVSFLDPERDPQGTGYQLIQSKIAVGAGGTWGKGVTKGSQTQLRFLPVPHTDFIFSAFAEEHGFIGVTGRTDSLLRSAYADRAKRTNGARPRRNVHLYGRRGAAIISYTGKRRDGGGADAGYRNTVAADELRRVKHLVDVFDARSGK